MLIALSLLPKLGVAQTDSLRLLWRNEAISGITAHAFSHSGKILALANDHEIRFWNLDSSRFTRVIPAPWHIYNGIAFTPEDSEIVLVSSNRPAHPYGVFPGRYVTAPRMIFRYSLAIGRWDSIDPALQPDDRWALSPDGESVAVLTQYGVVSLHETHSFQVEKWKDLPKDTVYHPYGVPSGIFFAEHKIIVYWRNQYKFLDPETLKDVGGIEGSLPGYLPSSPIGDRIFIKYGDRPSVYHTEDGKPALLQPPTIFTREFPDFPALLLNAVLLDHSKYLVSRYEAETWTVPIDYGTRTGIDTLIVSSTEHPSGGWGLQISPATQILGTLPNDHGLLLGDGNSFWVLDLHAKTIQPIIQDVTTVCGFFQNGLLALRNRSALLAINPKNDSIVWQKTSIPEGSMFLASDGRSLALATWKGVRYYYEDGRERDIDSGFSDYPYLLALLQGKLLLRADSRQLPMLYNISDLKAGLAQPALGNYYAFLPIGHDSIIAYNRCCNDSAILYDCEKLEILRVFMGGLHAGIATCAVSDDHRWLVTVNRFRNARLWRLDDDSLMSSFRLHTQGDINSLMFTPNDRFLLFSDDSSVMEYDIADGRQAMLLHGNTPEIHISSDGAKLAVRSWQKGLVMYEVPNSWRLNN